jgi:putative peptidoglycan lipid II flippase
MGVSRSAPRSPQTQSTKVLANGSRHQSQLTRVIRTPSHHVPSMPMSVGTQAADSRRERSLPLMLLGGYAAVAETAWMGVAQASDVLEPLRSALSRWLSPAIRRPSAALLTRQFTIAQATVLLMASFFLSALLGAVRQVLFNAEFGAGSEANAYYAAFRLPDLLYSLVAGGALSSAMIPVLASVAAEEDDRAVRRLTALVLTSLLALFTLLTLVGELFAPAFVTGVLAPGFDAQTSELTVAITRIMLLQPLVLAIGSVATAVLNARSQFLLTALSVASHNICLIAGILATRANPALGIYGPTIGVVLGAALQVVILLPGFLSGGFRFQLAWKLDDPRLREVIRLLIPNGLAVGVVYAGGIADTAFASTAPQTAGLPALHNAFLLVGLPIALLGQAIGQSAFPRLAAHAAALEWSALRRTVLRSLVAAIGLSVPVLLALVVLGRLVVRVIFEHGRYDADAGALTYAVMVVYVLGLPAYVGTEILGRGLIALRDTRTPLFTNTAQVGGRIAIMAASVGALGVLAVPIAFAVMAFVESAILAAVLLAKIRRRLRATGTFSRDWVGARAGPAASA